MFFSWGQWLMTDLPVCHPLSYQVTMNKGFLELSNVLTGLQGSVVTTVQTSWVLVFPFAAPVKLIIFHVRLPSVRACMCNLPFVWDLTHSLAPFWLLWFLLCWYSCPTLNSLCHPEDAINHWEAKGLFHLCLPSHICYPLLCFVASMTYLQPKSGYSQKPRSWCHWLTFFLHFCWIHWSTAWNSEMKKSVDEIMVKKELDLQHLLTVLRRHGVFWSLLNGTPLKFNKWPNIPQFPAWTYILLVYKFDNTLGISLFWSLSF